MLLKFPWPPPRAIYRVNGHHAICTVGADLIRIIAARKRYFPPEGAETPALQPAQRTLRRFRWQSSVGFPNSAEFRPRERLIEKRIEQPVPLMKDVTTEISPPR